jgi:hypothetical protein
VNAQTRKLDASRTFRRGWPADAGDMVRTSV